jgi:hypothetical protein
MPIESRLACRFPYSRRGSYARKLSTSLLQAANDAADAWCDGKTSMPDKDGDTSMATMVSGPK